MMFIAAFPHARSDLFCAFHFVIQGERILEGDHNAGAAEERSTKRRACRESKGKCVLPVPTPTQSNFHLQQNDTCRR